MIELRAIRAALSGAKPTGASTGNKEIPLPDQVIDDAESVEVHFGKNKGVPLGQLAARSLEWYAQEGEPKLDRNGNPFPPRPEDVRLKNAARTIYHSRKGTIPTSRKAPTLDESDVAF